MRTRIRVALTVAFGLFSLPPLIFGLDLLACSLRIHTTNVYYVEYPYLASASAFIALGAVILFCAVYGAWHRVESPPAQSFYSQRGHRLLYQLVVVKDASGPRLDDVSERPGVVYYCVSSDQQQYWVTMTGLHKDTSPTATLKRIIDRPDQQPMIVTAAGKDYPIRTR